MSNEYPETIYHRIKSLMPADLPNRVLGVLQMHRGQQNRISRIDLVNAIFGLNMPAYAKLENLTEDRQIRSAIEELQGKYPILASSGMGGYYYAASVLEINRYIREIDSRAMKLMEKSRRLQRIASQEFGTLPLQQKFW